MKKLIIVFSHKLTDLQEKDAVNSLSVGDFVYLPKSLQRIWSNIDPQKDDTDEEVSLILNWVLENASSKDIVLVQGEPGAAYSLVKLLKEKKLTVVYSTTKREAFEIKDSDGSISIIHKIRHVRYREY